VLARPATHVGLLNKGNNNNNKRNADSTVSDISTKQILSTIAGSSETPEVEIIEAPQQKQKRGHSMPTIHRIWGHATDERLRQTALSKSITSLHFTRRRRKHGKPCRCDTCLRMNARKAKFKKKARNRATVRGGRIHSDLKELPVRTKKGHKWAVCFVDDKTRRGRSYPLKKKSDTLLMFQKFLAEECSPLGVKVLILRSDHGGEYISGETQAYCQSHQISQEWSPPHCQSGNGVSEVYWRETFRIVRAILWDQQRDHTYWAVALWFADTIRNHLTTSAVPDAVPESAWKQKVVDTSHFTVPLCDCFAFIEKKNRDGTLGSRRIKGVLVGYAANSTSYLVYEPESGEVYSRRYEDCECILDSKAPEDVSEIDPDTLDAQLQAIDNAVVTIQDAVSSSPPPVPAVDTTGSDGIITHGDSQFYRTRRSQTVAEVAKLLNEDPDEYLAMLWQYEGWYSALSSTGSIISAGSDVPIPTDDGDIPPAPPPPIAIKPTMAIDTDAPSTLAVEIEGVRRSGRQRQHPTRLSQQAMLLLDTHKKEEAALAAQSLYVAHTESRGWSSLKDEEVLEMLCAERELEADMPVTALELAARAVTTAPKHYGQAHKGKDSQEWSTSENKEWDGLWDKETFEDQPYDGQKLHHLIWTYKIKSDSTKKSRLCIDGRHQDPDTYDATRSPTMKLASFRLLLSKAAEHNWDVYADDATQAFVNAERPVDKPLWAAYPAGFKKPGRCMLVKRHLYGSHDASRAWFELVKKHLVEEQKLTQSLTDEALFTGPGLYVVVHVDDFCSTGEDVAVKAFRDALKARFTMTGGKIKEYYGLDVRVRRKQGIIDVGCGGYIRRLVAKLKHNPRKILTPLSPDDPLPKMEGECKDKALQRSYRQLVGSIMHPAVTCRPDVAAAVRALSAHLVHPTATHLRAAQRVVDYLWTTRDHTLRFGNERGEGSFYGTCDAAFNATHDSRGITGWCYLHAGGAVAWKSRAQDLVSLSSCEAELIACDEATRELRYLLKLLQDFDIEAHTPIMVGQDNMGTLSLIDSTHYNARTRHIALRYLHTGDQQRAGVLQTSHLPTDQISSDVLTKPLPREAHERHTQVLLGHKSVQWPARSERQNSIGGKRQIDHASSHWCSDVTGPKPVLKYSYSRSAKRHRSR